MHVGHKWLRRFSLMVVAGLVSGAFVFCQEESIEIDLLPHSVVDALKSRFAKAEMAIAHKKEYVGRTVYQIALTQKRQKYMATIAENGGILEIDKEISAVDLPDMVNRAILARHPGGMISSAQEITEIKYSVTVKTETGEKVKISVDPSGTIEEDEDD